jgi:hypothetical protein
MGAGAGLAAAAALFAILAPNVIFIP